MVRLMADVLYELLNLPIQTTIIIRGCQTAASSFSGSRVSLTTCFVDKSSP
nr:MAG TPA: hypothetical protein [Caudoviricetes sp.]